MPNKQNRVKRLEQIAPPRPDNRLIETCGEYGATITPLYITIPADNAAAKDAILSLNPTQKLYTGCSPDDWD
jgi:hypothetical protein